MSNLLEIKDLKVCYHTYQGDVQSVRGVNLNIDYEESVALVGESGCGKSVTGKSILRLIQTPGEIREGSSITFDGKDVLAMSKKELRSYRGGQASIIFQDALASLNPTMTVGKQIMENLLYHRKMSKKEAKAEAVKLLKDVGIPQAEKRVDQYPHEFSGGMRQRVMIAIAFACQPKLLIADEPTTALDVTIQSQIIKLLKQLKTENHTSILMITHDLGVVASIAERIFVMYSGVIVEKGTSGGYFLSGAASLYQGTAACSPPAGRRQEGRTGFHRGHPSGSDRTPGRMSVCTALQILYAHLRKGDAGGHGIWRKACRCLLAPS